MKNVLIALSLLLSAVTAQAGEYRYVEPQEMKSWLESGKEFVLVDIQPAKDFSRQHFAGAIETNAFPVETPEEQQRLDVAVAAAKDNTKDVVVVCPRGKGGAKRTYDYLKAAGVAEERLYILANGMDGWPFKELVNGK
ncbi:MAG: rhodanese-like domain-containing protein [Thermodesulfobacteriota bacterium]